MRSLDEKADLARRMAHSAAERGQRLLRERSAAVLEESAAAAEVLRTYLTMMGPPELADTGGE